MNLEAKNNFRRSPFFYVGDKFKLLPQIVPYFPNKIDRFIEPFCGGGSVFLNTEANCYCLNDINTYLIKLHNELISFSKNKELFWKRIKEIIQHYNLSATYYGRDVPQEYRKKYPKTYFAHYNKEAYLEMRNDYNKNKDDLLLLYLLIIYGFNRMLRFNQKGDFNLPVGNVDLNANVVNALEAYFSYSHDINISLYNMDFQDFVDTINPSQNDFVYFDPPYLISSSEYNKLWDEEHEIRLIKLIDELNQKKIRFAISNVLWHRKQHNGTFNEWAKKYNIINIKSNYISYHDNSIKDSVEVLVTNY